MRNVAVTEDGCWLWKGAKTPNGYGKFRRAGQPERVAHRILWEHNNGPVPEGMELDHTCRTRECVRPTHFEVVTPSENTRRQDHANRNKTHCPQGHEYTPENTRLDSKNRRTCRECERARTRARRRTTSAPPVR
jgi:hypothetical protein